MLKKRACWNIKLAFRFDRVVLGATPRLAPCLTPTTPRAPVGPHTDGGLGMPTPTLSPAMNTKTPKPTSPPCTRCGKQPEFVTSMLDPKAGRIVLMFQCQCGNTSWTSEKA